MGGKPYSRELLLEVPHSWFKLTSVGSEALAVGSEAQDF